VKIHFTAEYHSPADKKDRDSLPGSYSHETYEFDWEGENLDEFFNTVMKFDDKFHEAEKKRGEEGQKDE